MYKLIVIGASTSGKSTLMRYLRRHTDLVVTEMDEEIVKLNKGKWPTDDDYRNTVLVPKITEKIIGMDEVVYISSYVPDELAEDAKRKGFTIASLEVSLEQLKARNAKRMREEKYRSVAAYFDMQLNGFKRLKDKGLIEKTIDGHKTTKEIADEISAIATGA
jgi:adenylate kinase family enzyme